MALPNLLAGSNPRTLGDTLRSASPDVVAQFYRVLSEPVEGIYPMSALFLNWEGGGSVDDIIRRVWDRLADTTVADFIYFANSSNTLKYALSKLSSVAQDQLGIIVPPQLVPLPTPVNPVLVIQSGIHGNVSLRDAVEALSDTDRAVFGTAMITPIDGVTPAQELAAALNDRKRAKRWRGDYAVTYPEVTKLLDNNHGVTVDYFIETLNLKPEAYPHLIRAITGLPQHIRETVGFWVTEVPHPLPPIRATNRYTRTDVGGVLQDNNRDMAEFYRVMSTPIDGISPEKLVAWYQWYKIPNDAALQQTRTGGAPWSRYNYLDQIQLVTMANKNPILWHALVSLPDTILQKLGITVPPEARMPAIPPRPVSPLLLPPAVTVATLPPPAVLAIPRPTVTIPPPTVLAIPRPTVVIPPPTVLAIPRPTVVLPPPTVIIPPPTVRPPTTFVIPPPTVKVPPPTRVTLAPAVFDLATLTREYVLSVALADPVFRATLQQLKTAQGFGPNTIRVMDDHDPNKQYYFDTNGVVVVVQFNSDGTSTAPDADPELARKYPVAWITYAFRNQPQFQEYQIVEDWGTIRTKNRLYVAPDNTVHLAKNNSGINLSLKDKDAAFDRAVRGTRSVYIQAQGLPDQLREGQYEAHVYLTVPELAAL